MTVDRFGNRRVPKMYAQINELRAMIAAEGTPRIQAAWGKVEEHIDFAYAQAGAADSSRAWWKTSDKTLPPAWRNK